MKFSQFVGPLSAVAVISAFGAALAVSTPVPAMDAEAKASATTTQSTAALVEAGQYKADPAHSFVTFTVDHFGVTPYTGLFGDVDGTLVLDPAKPQDAKVDMTIPVSKLTVANAGLHDHLLRAPKEATGKPDFFGPAPADAHFVSTGITSTGAETATLNGKLTLNGVTRDVSMPVEFHGAAKMPPQMNNALSIGFTAHTEIRRSEFGLGYGIPMVSDAVKLDIVAAFIKDAPKP
ncbi:YceI family protein [Novosphingobium colocasiae]|uniref:YceI family protein n=1 Tax=Novosphingobium colocasiae TaxID=1256513 RepID=UPI0035B33229